MTSLHPVLPMLATAGDVSLLESLLEHHVIEPKLDGIRCIAVCENGECRLFNRQLKDITHRFPEVAIAPAARNCILDGELISFQHPDTSLYNADFQNMQRRANRDLDIQVNSEQYPAVFYAFDVIYLNGVNLAPHDLLSRRRFLNQLELPYRVPWLSMREVVQGKGEGLIIKDGLSAYTPGLRNPAWRKVKWEKEEWFYVCGYTPGNGKRADSFGALLVGSWEGVPGTEFIDQDKVVYTGITFKYRGEVGTGYTDEDLAKFTGLCQRHLVPMHERREFTALRAEVPSNARFTLPNFQIKVKFNEYTNDGKLRFPRYVGECLVPDYDQLSR